MDDNYRKLIDELGPPVDWGVVEAHEAELGFNVVPRDEDTEDSYGEESFA